jgi:hypothetical protein
MQYYQLSASPERTRMQRQTNLRIKLQTIGMGAALGAGSGSVVFASASQTFIGALGTSPDNVLYTACLVTLSIIGGIIGSHFAPKRSKFIPLTDIAEEQFISDAQPAEKPIDSPITTIVYENNSHYPHSDTFGRDQALSIARHTLLSMDHTKAVPH